MRKVPSIILVILSMSVCAFADEAKQAETKRPKLTSKEDCKKAIEQTFAKMKDDSKRGTAVAELLEAYPPDKSRLAEIIPKVKRQFEATTYELTKRYGKPAPHFEFLDMARIGSSVLMICYMENREFLPMPWVFTFYKRDKEWKVMRFALGDQAWPYVLPFAKVEEKK